MIVQNQKHGIVVFKDSLDGPLCDGLINLVQESSKALTRLDSESIGYVNGTHYSEKTLYLEQSPGFEKMMKSKVLEVRNAYFDYFKIHHNSQIIKFFNPIIKQYNSDSKDQMLMHYDSSGKTTNRALAMIWYLNDVEQGGETVFPSYHYEVKAQKGNCLVFPAYWNYPHLARKPVSGDKYTLNSFGHVND
jgi:hypothetical protein